MTRETTYANERLTIELCDLDHPPTLLRSSNVGALTFSARVVMSYLKDPSRQSVEPKERGCSPKSHVQGFVVNANAHITVLYELVNGEQSIVWLSIKGGQILSRKSSFGVA
jgi:hypothetical protein